MATKKTEDGTRAFVRALAMTARQFAPSDDAFCEALAKHYLAERGIPEVMPTLEVKRRGRMAKVAAA